MYGLDFDEHFEDARLGGALEGGQGFVEGELGADEWFGIDTFVG